MPFLRRNLAIVFFHFLFSATISALYEHDNCRILFCGKFRNNERCRSSISL